MPTIHDEEDALDIDIAPEMDTIRIEFKDGSVQEHAWDIWVSIANMILGMNTYRNSTEEVNKIDYSDDARINAQKAITRQFRMMLVSVMAEQNVLQTELAIRTGLSRQRIHQIVNDTTNSTTLKSAARLMHALGYQASIQITKLPQRDELNIPAEEEYNRQDGY